MFSSISWAEFVGFILLVLTFYYLVIAMLFYRAELSRIVLDVNYTLRNFRNKKIVLNDISKDGVEQGSLVNISKNFDLKKSDCFKDVSKAHFELEEVIETARVRDFTRDDLMTALQTILKKYPGRFEKEFTDPISIMIQTQLEINSIPVLSEQEFNLLWKN